ncbi:K(+)-transporting ATPase subunit F [Pseudonocardia sp. Cha107L01]|uniref:K(+)-transporting ATPase subunit F n=1 Tax=Pseudonocardia sp. Cha107L01 TaxID=3457576 RepID=UPI00403E4957
MAGATAPLKTRQEAVVRVLGRRAGPYLTSGARAVLEWTGGESLVLRTAAQVWIGNRSSDGGSDLYGADHRRFRGPGAAAAGSGATVSVENVVGLVVSVLLAGYLVIALVRPEKF